MKFLLSLISILATGEGGVSGIIGNLRLTFILDNFFQERSRSTILDFNMYVYCLFST